jgi:hypothetical protein
MTPAPECSTETEVVRRKMHVWWHQYVMSH